MSTKVTLKGSGRTFKAENFDDYICFESPGDAMFHFHLDEDERQKLANLLNEKDEKDKAEPEPVNPDQWWEDMKVNSIEISCLLEDAEGRRECAEHHIKGLLE